ncbi:glycosyl transferase [Hyphomonas sp.]|uniref:glycosyl transferase n=1 Tax=Hyphomonas sp. TaxID=87 RepID=UPI00391D1DD2
MTRIAFFGHDAGDAAVRRRAVALRDDGFDVTGFMMRRGEPAATEWPLIDLGRTRDGAFIQRILQVLRGARTAARAKETLASADLIYARNLDMLACAFLAKRLAGLNTPVVYESLDVHRMLCRKDVIGSVLRWLEGALLARSAALVVSSPGFLRNHFERHYPPHPRTMLIENRLAGGQGYGERRPSDTSEVPGKLRIGWVGNLRCKRSLDLLCALADELGDAVEIRLHGVPARTEIPVFEPLIEARANMSYHGRYRSPEDLAAIYAGLDAVWAGDFMEAGYNSVWLLPNRIYEGGYFCTPAIAPADTETAAWLERHDCGFTLAEPLEKSLPDLARRLLADPAPLRGKAEVLARLPEDAFVQPRGYLLALLAGVPGVPAAPMPAQEVCA